MDVDTQAQVLGAWIRTAFTLAVLLAVLDFMIEPMIAEWYRRRRREKARKHSTR